MTHIHKIFQNILNITGVESKIYFKSTGTVNEINDRNQFRF